MVLECNSPKYANCEARNVVGAAVVGGPPVWTRGSLGAPVWPCAGEEGGHLLARVT